MRHSVDGDYRVFKARLTNIELCVYKIMHERGLGNNEMADGVLPDPAPPAPTDPRLPFNARQVFKLKKSWKGIKRNMGSTGVEMFVRYGLSRTIYFTI